jgi:predicted protein tyrosine phosphatase
LGRHILQVHREIIPGPVMDFLVLGRGEVQRVAPEAPHILISICSPDGEDAPVPHCPSRLDVLRLRFHDVEVDEPGSPYTLVSSEHAREILNFVRLYLAEVKLIVCQCDAGMSRSAGVAAALSRWLQNDDKAFFRYYLPNRLVYSTVLSAVETLRPANA